MNDTHGVEGKGWYGFDLDGTLAKYELRLRDDSVIEKWSRGQ